KERGGFRFGHIAPENDLPIPCCPIYAFLEGYKKRSIPSTSSLDLYCAQKRYKQSQQACLHIFFSRRLSRRIVPGRDHTNFPINPHIPPGPGETPLFPLCFYIFPIVNPRGFRGPSLSPYCSGRVVSFRQYKNG